MEAATQPEIIENNEICRSKLFESAPHSMAGLDDFICLFNVNDSMTFILGESTKRESMVNT